MPPKVISKKERYLKLDPISHIIARPDTYVGSNRLRETNEYIAVREEEKYRIYQSQIKSSPAILRIFVEALSNAIDNVERSRKTKTPCTKIMVNIDEKSGKTSIWNDGDIVPIELHSVEKCYNHTMIFGQLLTGSNYDDEEERIVSGRNGLGIKLVNIFSSYFCVRGCDPKNKKFLSQEWTNNMKETMGPIVSDTVVKEGFTEVSWIPDFKHFGLTSYTPDIIRLYTKYVIDAAMLSKASVYFNDELIPVKSLQEYALLYETPSDEKLYIKIKNTEILLTPSKEFQAVSFVNGVFTKLGGRHVDAWSEALFRPIVDNFNNKDKKAKTPKININDVKQFFRLFVVSTVIRPEFDGQDKNKLESPEVEAIVKRTHISSISKWKVMDNIEDLIRAKEMVVLKKAEKTTKNTKIEGYDRANKSGTKDSVNCSLFITEGLSAKTYVVSGINNDIYGYGGRDFTGILPVRGKLLNVRDKPPTTIADNKVICSLIHALGLKHGIDYSDDANFRKLNYGRLIVVADADCFTKDTPFLIKRNDFIDVLSCENLFYSNYKNISIWTNKGWTPVKEMVKKESRKRILQISTQSGLIRCTEDHKLILENGKEIRACDIIIGDKLLTTDRFENLKFCHNCTDIINSDIGYIYGALFSAGNIQKPSSNERKISFHITPTRMRTQNISQSQTSRMKKNFQRYSGIDISSNNFDFLKKCKSILEHNYQSLEWKITTQCGSYKLSLMTKNERYVKSMYENFYIDLHKKVPREILNSSLEIQQSFLDGVHDGFINNQSKFSVNGQVGTQGLCIVLEKLGYKCSISESKNIFTISFDRNNSYENFENSDSRGMVKSIDTIHYNDYVYDVETENHLLNAGIGNIIVHNCDGIHIEGLIMNFIHSLYPSLLNRKTPFLISMKTPIVRVTIPRGVDLLFYDERRFEHWLGNQTKKFEIKYYKGLGTTKPEDIPDTFGKKLVEYEIDEKSFDSMQKAFHKKYSDARKEWLAEYDPSRFTFSLDDVDGTSSMKITDFINEELIKFSHADCARSIPCGIDGLKESQQKILYAAKKRKLGYKNKSSKVEQFAGYVAEHTSYAHGGQNLIDNIIGMAQAYPGTNNLPLFYRDGMFGSRLEGGKDAAAGRYIFTKMEKLTELIFREEDEHLLKQVNCDGDLVQPEYYVPILPMILINGCSAGIGTGWSSSIPCYNPLDMIEGIKIWLENDGEVLLTDPDNPTMTVSLFPEFTPWYRGFNGDIEKSSPTRYVTYGIIEEENKANVVSVKELPIGMWSANFLEFCKDLEADKKLKNFSNYCSEVDVHVVLTENENFTADLDTLKLHSYLHTSNMVMFDENKRLRKYDSVEQILDNFCKVRFEYYEKRKISQLKMLEEEIKFFENKHRFIQEVIDEKISIMNEKECDIVNVLSERGYAEDPKKEENEDGGYNYLLRMHIRTFTVEKIEQLKNEIISKQEKIDKLRETSEKDIWLGELDEFEKEYKIWLKEIEKEEAKAKKRKAKKSKK